MENVNNIKQIQAGDFVRWTDRYDHACYGTVRAIDGSMATVETLERGECRLSLADLSVMQSSIVATPEGQRWA